MLDRQLVKKIQMKTMKMMRKKKRKRRKQQSYQKAPMYQRRRRQRVKKIPHTKAMHRLPLRGNAETPAVLRRQVALTRSPWTNHRRVEEIQFLLKKTTQVPPR